LGVFRALPPVTFRLPAQKIAVPTLRASDPNPNEKHQYSPDNYLKCGAEIVPKKSAA